MIDFLKKYKIHIGIVLAVIISYLILRKSLQNYDDRIRYEMPKNAVILHEKANVFKILGNEISETKIQLSKDTPLIIGGEINEFYIVDWCEGLLIQKTDIKI